MSTENHKIDADRRIVCDLLDEGRYTADILLRFYKTIWDAPQAA